MIDEEGTLKRIDYNSAIYFDSILGIAGTTYPIGSTQMPSNTIADVITLCALNNIRKINVRGILVLGAAMSGYRFEGYKHLDIAHTVDLGGQDVSVSSFHRLIITGVQAGAGLASYDDCVLLAMTGFNGTASKCGLTTTLGLAAGTLSQFVDCFSYLGPCTITLGTPNPANFTNLTGSIILEGQTGGTTNIWAADNCEIVINVGCNGGTINIYGSAIITDNSAGGCTVNDYTNNMVPAADAATNVQLRDVVGNKTDTALTAYTAADSMMRYVKGLLDQATTLTTRLSAVRAGYLDELAAANLPADVDAILTDTGTTLPGLLATIQADLDNPDQYKADVAALALEATLTAIKGAGWTDENLTTIDALIDAIKAVTDQLPNGGALNDLATLEARLTAVRAGYLDELAAANIPADVDELKASKGRQLFSMDFWSDPQEEIQVPAAAATLVFTPTVTVADLPAGATIVRAIAMFKFRIVENTYAGVNALDGATVANTSQVIQVKETAAGAYIDAIKFADNQFTLDDAAREGGDVLVGSIDIAAQVDGNDSYTFQWKMRKADFDFINFNDCQVGLRILYSV